MFMKLHFTMTIAQARIKIYVIYARYFLIKYAENIKIITINDLLLTGHSYMLVYSIHACIDKNI